MKKYIKFYKNIEEIYDKNAFIAIINYSGANEEEFLRHIYKQIGIPGDTENFDALNDDYSSFYWVRDKTQIFLVHESLPDNNKIIDDYLDILFYSIQKHINNPYTYYDDNHNGIELYKKEYLYSYFRDENKYFIEKKIDEYLKSNDYYRRQKDLCEK